MSADNKVTTQVEMATEPQLRYLRERDRLPEDRLALLTKESASEEIKRMHREDRINAAQPMTAAQMRELVQKGGYNVPFLETKNKGWASREIYRIKQARGELKPRKSKDADAEKAS